MYKRILLAYDGTLEGRTALREGALLAKRCDAQVYLLSVIVETPGVRMARIEAGPFTQSEDGYKEILADGVARLQKLGFAPIARLAAGDPPQVIGAYAKQINAELVVVGHRKQGALERWWSGPSGAYLIDYVPCSLLVSRNVISEADFAAELRRIEEGAARAKSE